MKYLLLICLITQLFVSSAFGNIGKDEMKGMMKQIESQLKLDIQSTIKRINNGKIEPKKLAIIYLILKYTGEHFSHNLNGVTGNKVYYHEDGHKEAVYDSTGKLVEDGINNGSYNYFDYRKNPLKHFSFDSNPWLLWGSSRTDPTSKKERIFGFVSDFEYGLYKALQNKTSLDDLLNTEWDNSGQTQALSILIKALETENSNILFNLFEKELSKLTPGEVMLGLREFETGLQKIYGYERKDPEPLKTSLEFQSDADILRLKHLKYYGHLIQEYNNKTGKYPFQGDKNVPVYVHVANDKQVEGAKKNGPKYSHYVIEFSKFVQEIESALGYEIEEYFDPQFAPDYKPNFYLYMVNQDVYYFAIHVHQPFSFSKEVAAHYHKVEITNNPGFRNQAYDPSWLFSSDDFNFEMNKIVVKKGFFEEREKKYLNFTKKSNNN